MRAQARRLRRPLPACAALALALVLPGVAAAADGGSAMASDGAVQATLTWQAAESGNKGGFRDVTRRFPALARRNLREALHLLASARRQHAETLGAVAAYVADLYLLGRGREVRPYLARARKRGDLRTFTGRAPRSFDRQLLAFLHKQGYR